MPPGAALEVHLAMERKFNLVGMVHVAPRVGRIKGVVRIGKRGPQAERAVTVFPQVVDGAVAYPGGVVPGHRQARIEGFMGVADRRQAFAVQGGALFAAAVGVVPALVGVAQRRLHGREHVVPFEHHLHMIEPHVGAVPVRRVVGAAHRAFRCAGGFEAVRGTEVRLADQSGGIAGLGQGATVACRAGRGWQVDAVVRHAVGKREQPGEYGCARGLAHQVGRDGRRETGAVACHFVQVRRLDAPSLEAIAIGTLLVGGDEKDIGLFVHGFIQVGCRRRGTARDSAGFRIARSG